MTKSTDFSFQVKHCRDLKEIFHVVLNRRQELVVVYVQDVLFVQVHTALRRIK